MRTASLCFARGLADHQLDKIQQELLAACQLIQPPYFRC